MLKLWLPPKVWFQGSQSTMHRRPVLEERPDLREHLLVRAEHALGVDHALGRAGRAGGEEDLRDGVGPDRARTRSSTARRRRGVEQRRDRRGGRADRGERGREVRRVRAYTRPGCSSSKMRLELGEVLRHQRVRGRDRRDRHADVHRAEREQRVVDAVVREDRDRPLGPEAAVEQRLADAARRRERFAVGDPPPAVAGALGEERAVGRARRPVHEPLADRARGGASGCGERSTIEPSARRSTSTPAGAKRGCGRMGSPPRSSGGCLPQPNPAEFYQTLIRARRSR